MNNNFAKKITTVNIEEELKKSYLDYAMSVIIGRALPDIRDGLKPVHRRILFAMNVLKNFWNKPYKKSARVVGDVIGKYHPHGDNAVYDTIVRMAQVFSLRYTLIDGQGNFGSVDGDSAAAMRYTEIRMSKIAHELLIDLEKDTVNFIHNYDNTEKIPEVLPSRIPNLLINGSSGIAVGMATNIPPHNISEVIDGCIAYIKDKNISIKKLMYHIPGPDFPTAAIINGKKGIENAYRTGKGKIHIRANAIIKKNKKNKQETIIINEIPYQVNKSRLIEKIAELVKEKKIDGISNLRDESDKDGMRIVITLKKDTLGNVVLNNLYSLTQLQISFGINIVALHNGQPKLLSLKNILSAFIKHRKEIVTRRTIFELNKAREQAHNIEGIIIALVNIKSIIKVISKSSNILEAKTSLITRSWSVGISSNIININNKKIKPQWLNKKYGKHNNQYYLTIKQAQIILDLRLQKLTNLEFKKLFKEYKKLKISINKFISIMENKDRLLEVINEELMIIKENYNDSRRTKIIDKKSDVNIEDLINKKDVVVTLSHYGYVKYQPIKDYEAQHRGGKGKFVTNIKKEDFIVKLLVANTHDNILLFSSKGIMYWMKVYQLPESNRSSRGKPITNLLPLDKNEIITAILAVHKYEKNYNVFMSTSHGTVKKTSLIEFINQRRSGIIAIHLNDGDTLIGVDLTNGNNEVMLFSAFGKVVRFKENQVRNMGRKAIGVRGIILQKNDKVVSLIIPRNKSHILTVTQNGFGKRTIQSEYPIKSRSTKGVISIKVSKRNGKVIGAIQVEKKDQIMMITNSGKLVRTRVSEVSIIGRNTQGVILIRTTKKEKVVGLQRITKLI